VPISLTFEGCIQDAQEFGSDDVWIVSRVFFWIREEGALLGDFAADLRRVAGDKFDRMRISAPLQYTGPMAYADLRQRVGEDFETGPIEVAPPVSAPVSLDQAKFSEQAIAYFRGFATESGTMMRVDEGRLLRGGTRPSAHVRLSHNVRVKRRTVRLEGHFE
jgi:hypothetical protein